MYNFCQNLQQAKHHHPQFTVKECEAQRQKATWTNHTDSERIHPLIPLSTHSFVHPPILPSFLSSPIHPSFHPSIHPSIHLSIHLPICHPSMCLPIHLPIHPSLSPVFVENLQQVQLLLQLPISQMRKLRLKEGLESASPSVDSTCYLMEP